MSNHMSYDEFKRSLYGSPIETTGPYYAKITDCIIDKSKTTGLNQVLKLRFTTAEGCYFDHYIYLYPESHYRLNHFMYQLLPKDVHNTFSWESIYTNDTEYILCFFKEYFIGQHCIIHLRQSEYFKKQNKFVLEMYNVEAYSGKNEPITCNCTFKIYGSSSEVSNYIVNEPTAENFDCPF